MLVPTPMQLVLHDYIPTAFQNNCLDKIVNLFCFRKSQNKFSVFVLEAATVPAKLS